MKGLGKLNVMLVLFVLALMLVSGVITGTLYMALVHYRSAPMDLKEQLIYLGACLLVSLVIGTAATVFISRRTLRPMSQLARATLSVAEGDFSVRVRETKGKSDLALLLRSFNHMAEELESLEIFRNDFISSFSHEFKTPLASIRGFARQLERDDLTAEERTEYARIIASEAARLSSMSGNVLLLSKLENQTIVTDRSAFRLDEQLRRALVTLEKRWSAKELELDLNLDEVTYTGNKEMLSHVWLNILDNAVKFSRQGGRINLSLWEDEKSVFVAIGDNGIGMDPFVKRRIFDKFYQADDTRSTDGNGLGLPLVRRIVTLTGGKIDVESAPGKGTLFTVQLPKNAEE